MTSPASHLARHQPKPALSEGQVLAMGAWAWGEPKTLVVRLSQVKGPTIRGRVVAIADYLFGRCPDG